MQVKEAVNETGLCAVSGSVMELVNWTGFCYPVSPFLVSLTMCVCLCQIQTDPLSGQGVPNAVTHSQTVGHMLSLRSHLGKEFALMNNIKATSTKPSISQLL